MQSGEQSAARTVVYGVGHRFEWLYAQYICIVNVGEYVLGPLGHGVHGRSHEFSGGAVFDVVINGGVRVPVGQRLVHVAIPNIFDGVRRPFPMLGVGDARFFDFLRQWGNHSFVNRVYNILL